MIAPGAWLGVIGGGQLGRMFAHAAQSMGYRVAVLDPDPACPAGAVADAHFCARYDDEAALNEIAELCDAVTIEFENVPVASLRRLAASSTVAPSAACVEIAQDRAREKRFLTHCGLRVADHAVIARASDLESDAARHLLPGILKASRLGYDGKSQAHVNTIEQARAAFAAMGGVTCVLERLMPIECEISVVAVRSGRETVCYPATENQHSDGILATSILPARVAPHVERRARKIAVEVVEQLGYAGVLCVEFFVLRGGELVINEIAPRPHNSGHVTIDASVTSQFEQQVRVMCGLPLGDTRTRCPAVMLNLLGDVWRDGAPDWRAVLADSRARLHLYGKHEPRAGRKMGHITFTDDTIAAALARASRVRQLLAPL